MKRWPIVFVLLCVGSVGTLIGWKFWQIRSAMANAPAPVEPAETVAAVETKSIRWTPTASAVGTVAAIRTVTLRPEIAGRVTEIMFESGDRVAEGAVLVRLDTRTEEANLRAAVARVGLAKASLDRQRQALEARAISQQEIDIAQAELERAEAEADLIRTQINKKSLLAPFDAVIGLRNVHPGQYVGESDVIAQLQSAGPRMYVDFPVPQDLVPGVKIQNPVTVQIGFDAEPIGGVVSAIDSATSIQTRTVMVRATVTDDRGSLKPGMSVSVGFPRANEAEVVVIPTMSIRRASYGDHVFVLVDGEGQDGTPEVRARQRFVTLGETVGGDVVVRTGLKAGERIAAAGSFKLRDGAKVGISKASDSPRAGAAGPSAADAGKP